MNLNNLNPNTFSLLSLTAILHEFDKPLLQMFGYDTAEIDKFLASNQVALSADHPGRFMLFQDIQTTALNQLRSEHPEAELALHEQAFSCFLNQMHAALNSQQRLLAETRCFRHLEALRIALIERREWQRIRGFVTAIKQAEPTLPRHLQLITLYEGFGAVREQDYVAGKSILSALLQQPDLGTDLCMRAKNLLAQLHWFLADYDQALALYREVYELAQTLGDQIYQGHALHNMSLIYHMIGNYLQALELSSQSLQLFQLAGDTYHEAHLLYEVAKNAFQLGRLHDADQHFQRSAEMYTKLNMTAQRANLYTLQGMLSHALGDEQASEAQYRKSLTISSSPDHGDLPVSIDTWLLTGLLHQTQQHWPEALQAYQHATTLAFGLQNKHVLALTYFRQGELYKAQALPQLALERYHAAINQLEAMRGATDVEEIKLGLLGASQQMYESIILFLLELGQPIEAFHFVERARSRAFLDLLVRKSPALYASFDTPVATLAEIQAQLAPNAVMLEYYTTGVLPIGEHLVHQLKQTNPTLLECLVNKPKIIVFVITKTSFEALDIALNPNILRPSGHDIQPAHVWLQSRKLRTLYEYLLKPAEITLAKTEQIFLIPHGPLHHVPFLALQASNGEYMLHESGPTIAFAPSATILIRNCLARPIALHGTFLALGYNEPHIGLHHAEAEAQSVATIMQGAVLASTTAKRDALQEIAGTLSGLHIAGHAVYHPTDPLSSYISLGHEDQLDAHYVMQHFNLQPILVSLSACTSGRSQIVPGDELLGLLRSWLYAGAVTIVCSFWEANDIVSRLVMEHFYNQLHAGASPGVAFRDAVLAIQRTTGRELADTFARWRATDAIFGSDTRLPEISPEMCAILPYSDPTIWATFMLIGRM